METVILNQDTYFVLISPKGIESELLTKKEAEDAIKSGVFKKKSLARFDSLGPSSYGVYRTNTYKITKVKRVTFKNIRETEEGTPESLA